jgi:hypothetical protein
MEYTHRQPLIQIQSLFRCQNQNHFLSLIHFPTHYHCRILIHYQIPNPIHYQYYVSQQQRHLMHH